MSDNKTLRPHGNANPKGPAWLAEVKIDAARAAVQHVTKQLEEREFLAQKANGITVEDIIGAGKKRLVELGGVDDELDEGFGDDEGFDDDDDEGDDEVTLTPVRVNMSKKVLLEIAAAEGVEGVSQETANAKLVEAIELKRKGSE